MKRTHFHAVYIGVIIGLVYSLGHVIELKIRVKSMERVIGAMISVERLAEKNRRTREEMLMPVIRGKR